LRVYTRIQEFTKNRAQAERSIISDELFMINAQQKTSKFVLDSKVSAAKYKAQALRDLMSRTDMKEKVDFSRMEERVKNMPMSYKSSSMNDDYAQDFYAMAKMSRTKEAKQREIEERERERWFRRQAEEREKLVRQRETEERERIIKEKNAKPKISSSTIENQVDSNSTSDEDDKQK